MASWWVVCVAVLLGLCCTVETQTLRGHTKINTLDIDDQDDRIITDIEDPMYNPVGMPCDRNSDCKEPAKENLAWDHACLYLKCVRNECRARRVDNCEFCSAIPRTSGRNADCIFPYTNPATGVEMYSCLPIGSDHVCPTSLEGDGAWGICGPRCPLLGQAPTCKCQLDEQAPCSSLKDKFEFGTATCNRDCSWNFERCVEKEPTPLCPLDSECEAGETMPCVDADDVKWESGLLFCTDECKWDDESCVINHCDCKKGDSIQCKKLDKDYISGKAKCGKDCFWNKRQCRTEADCECIPGVQLSCGKVKSNKFQGGLAWCQKDCQWDFTKCTAEPGPGGECECEPGDIKRCNKVSPGFSSSGKANCMSDCMWNLESCRECECTTGTEKCAVLAPAKFRKGNAECQKCVWNFEKCKAVRCPEDSQCQTGKTKLCSKLDAKFQPIGKAVCNNECVWDLSPCIELCEAEQEVDCSTLDSDWVGTAPCKDGLWNLNKCNPIDGDN